MNEYRVPELNVQNGVLKSLSFLFEYIGEMGKDYIYAVTPLLEDALMDRQVQFDLKNLYDWLETVVREIWLVCELFDYSSKITVIIQLSKNYVITQLLLNQSFYSNSATSEYTKVT